MDPAMPRVLAQSLPVPRLPVSLWADSLASSPACTSSLRDTHDGQRPVPQEAARTEQEEEFPSSPVVLASAGSQGAAGQGVKVWGVTQSARGHREPLAGGGGAQTADRPVQTALAEARRLEGSPRVRHCGKTQKTGFTAPPTRSLRSHPAKDVLPLTRDGTVVLVEVDANAAALPSADAAASSPTQRDGHHAVHVRQHDGHADTWRGRTERTLSCLTLNR